MSPSVSQGFVVGLMRGSSSVMWSRGGDLAEVFTRGATASGGQSGCSEGTAQRYQRGSVYSAERVKVVDIVGGVEMSEGKEGGRQERGLVLRPLWQISMGELIGADPI